jgi:hypothetical protein
MKNFKDKKVIRKQVGGNFLPFGQSPAPNDFFEILNQRKKMQDLFLKKDDRRGEEARAALGRRISMERANEIVNRLTHRSPSNTPALPVPVASADVPADVSAAPAARPKVNMPVASVPKAATTPQFSGYSEYDYLTAPSATSPSVAAPSSEKNKMEEYKKQPPSFIMQDLSAFLKKAAKAPDAPPELAKAAGEIPKTKSGLKKFMQDYGQFIALGALAGQGGKGGQIAAPIIAALPGLIAMMKKKKSGSTPAATPGNVQVGMARGGFMKRSSGGETPKKSEGGAIRKFKGGSMKGNTMDSTLTPKYAKGGDMPKGMSKGKMGKAAGEMPQHKKMAMGKPTPQSTGAKFAKGGAAKYASGGMCKGYGISKKVRPTGPMN